MLKRLTLLQCGSVHWEVRVKTLVQGELFSIDLGKPLADQMTAAGKRFVEKHGCQPAGVHGNLPEAAEGVVADRSVPPGHLWLELGSRSGG
jgi:hypothetical protein